MKNLGILFLVVIGCSAQGADWTNKETKIIAKKLWSIASKPGRAIRQYLRAHPGYPVNRNLAFQIKPSPQKVKQFLVDKSSLKRQKWSILANFWKPEACGQTVLPDRSVLIGQKLVENVKIQMRTLAIHNKNRMARNFEMRLFETFSNTVLQILRTWIAGAALLLRQYKSWFV